MSLRRPSLDHWLLTQNFGSGVTLCGADEGFWIVREATRPTNRGTERRKRYLMYVIAVTGGVQPSLDQLMLKRSIDLAAKTRQPRVQRRSGQFSEGHQQNIRLVKDNDVIVQCYGAHILRMAGRTPTSRTRINGVAVSWMMWDDHPIEPPMLRELLRFELDPDTLNPLEVDTMHKPRLKDPALFDVGVHDLDPEEGDHVE